MINSILLILLVISIYSFFRQLKADIEKGLREYEKQKAEKELLEQLISFRVRNHQAMSKYLIHRRQLDKRINRTIKC